MGPGLSSCVPWIKSGFSGYPPSCSLGCCFLLEARTEGLPTPEPPEQCEAPLLDTQGTFPSSRLPRLGCACGFVSVQCLFLRHALSLSSGFRQRSLPHTPKSREGHESREGRALPRVTQPISGKPGCGLQLGDSSAAHPLS